MIQVCSLCGTRWNVRDRQRVWCPRCRGTLLAPSTEVPGADPRWSARSATQPAVRRRMGPRLPPGYRWIAVRPGAPPPARRRRPPLGPTPRYTAIPRWGLADHVGAATVGPASVLQKAPLAARVRATFLVSVLTLGIAAAVHLIRYVLLIINRNTLLNPVVVLASVALAVLASLAAIAAVGTCGVVLTRWLIARRAAAFAHCGRTEPRPVWALWVGCLAPPSIALVLAIAFAVLLGKMGHPASWALMAGCMTICCLPLLAVVWALVYLIELAQTEDQYSRLRKPIWGWWLLWVLSCVTSVFATVTGGAQDAQGIANNTVAMIVAYLLALAAVIATARVFEGFERKPVERPAHRWVVVPDDGNSPFGSGPAVESAGAEPAA